MYASTVNLSMNEKVYVFDDKINSSKHLIQNLAAVEDSNKQIDKINSSESLITAKPHDMNLRIARRDDVKKQNEDIMSKEISMQTLPRNFNVEENHNEISDRQDSVALIEADQRMFAAMQSIDIKIKNRT